MVSEIRSLSANFLPSRIKARRLGRQLFGRIAVNFFNLFRDSCI
ncbi:hypothetical protein [Peribacillus frigoritolerans]|uniref:Uncharacterized protein n=1 Tax=Peribacillus castrilensis TaxID=2897690 RepID=A0AAW9NL02_9BACI|nr:hypothetical protein [Peribacillus castrilensis]